MLTSTVVARFESRYAICVPQLLQNSRCPWWEDWYRAGTPRVYEKLAIGYDTQARTGAPVVRWHSLQWQ